MTSTGKSPAFALSQDYVDSYYWAEINETFVSGLVDERATTWNGIHENPGFDSIKLLF